MFKVNKVEREIGGRMLSIETGKIAKQADGAVVVTYGETMVLVTAVTAAPRFDDIDFFPLSVEYREKLSAAGKFPGGFMKREGRPSTKETLTARTIDRPIRPLFPEDYFQEVQIIVNVLSADKENDPDVLAMIGASAALSISKIPFMGPTGACRLGRIDGEFVINPTYEQVEQTDINLLLGGRKEAINMIEVGSKELSEDVIADAVAAAHKVVGDVCEMIDELVEKCGKVEKEIPLTSVDEEIVNQVKAKATDKVTDALQVADHQQRGAAVKQVITELAEEFCCDDEGKEPICSKAELKKAFEKVQKEVIRKILLSGKRIDGRGFDDIRDIFCEVGLLPRSHGSSLFTRGQTQAMVSATLGTSRDEQTVDGLMEEYGEKFMLHYNFPPSSVGEVRPIRGVGRREIGHGTLAKKALEQVLPNREDFGYTIKLVSDITESNGSSSMASICGGTLAMMDAGVPITKPVAGISIGLVSDGDDYKLLTDIIGTEDHFGEMDFKIAGTADGITAIQLDIKAEGLRHDIMVAALARAKEARLEILEKMSATISESRAELSTYAPKLTSIKIDPELIGKIIGPGGKMIKSIQEQTETKIDIEEDGTVSISCVGGDGYLKARQIVEDMTTPPEPGKIYKTSKVVSVKDFGVFVEFAPGTEGLCHISELSDAYVKSVEDVCKVGDIIPVKLILIDEQGRFKLSRKAALAELGESDEKKESVSENS